MRVRDPGRLAGMIASHIELSIPDKQALLATLDPVSRLEGLGDLRRGPREVKTTIQAHADLLHNGPLS
jgi:hypothetical protein